MNNGKKLYDELLAIPKRALSFDETNYEKNFAPLIVGVAGGSASGKTTLCDNIKKSFKDSCVMISLDSFYKNLEESMDPKHYNFDHPKALDFDLIFEVCNKLLRRQNATVPLYSFKTNRRLEESFEVQPKDLIFIEGILALYDERLRDLMSLKVFVHCDDDIRLCRRIKRDILERGREIQGILYQYHRFVRPAHNEFVQPTMNYADIIVPSNYYNDVSTKFVVQNLKAQLNGISRLKSYFTNTLFYNADLFTNVWLTPFAQKDNMSVYCEITYYLKNQLIFESNEIQKQLIKNYLNFFNESFDLKYFRMIIKYFLIYALELLEKQKDLSSLICDYDLIDLYKFVPVEKNKINNLFVLLPLLSEQNIDQVMEILNVNKDYFKSFKKVYFINIFATMKYLLLLTKFSSSFMIINISCLSNPMKFIMQTNEKCLDKFFSVEEEFRNLDKYLTFLRKKIEKKTKIIKKN